MSAAQPDVAPTVRYPFDGNPRLISFVHWLADRLDADFSVEDYGFDGREFEVDYDDGTSVVMTIAVRGTRPDQ